MVKFATDITVEERKHINHPGGSVYQLAKSMGVLSINENTTTLNANRFPFIAAVIANSSNIWSFSCFASVILVKWIVTSAHCRRHGATHRVLLFHDYTRNYTHTYPILFWRLHEKFNASKPTPKYDLAVAKLNVDLYPRTMKPSLFDESEVEKIEAGVWKTVSGMDKKVYLTNDFTTFLLRVVDKSKCFEGFGVSTDDSMICVDLSDYDDCFVQEFGPIYDGDKVVGVLAVKPRDCDTRLAIFTNVSFYTNWILKSTHASYYG